MKRQTVLLITLLACTLSKAFGTAEIHGNKVKPELASTRTTLEMNEQGKDTKKTLPPIISQKASTKPNPNHISINFTAASFANAPQVNVIPLNATGAVGEKQYILMSYQSVRSFNKRNGSPDGVLVTDAASFFNNSPSDVRIDYDRFSRRWFASAEIPSLTPGLGNDLLIVMSHDSVITDHTKWSTFRFTNAQLIPQISSPGQGSLDYNQLAIDENAVYNSIDTFDEVGDFVGTTTLVIEKKSLLEGSPHATIFPGIFPEPNSALSQFTPPADNFDKNPEFGYLIHASNQGFPSNTIYDQLYLYRIVNPGTSTPTLIGPFLIPVPAYTEASNAPHKGNLYGPAGFLQTGLFGGLMAPHVRNHQIFACHPIQVDRSGAGNPNGDRVGVRWYQIDLTGDSTGKAEGEETATTQPVLVQAGTLHDSKDTSAPKFYYISSIMTNRKQDLIISATVSGEKDFTNVAFASRRKKDSFGTLRKVKLLTQNITNAYNFGPLVNPFNGNIGQRWGDESSLSPDPVNDMDIWSTGEWAAIPNGWGVQVTQIKHTD